MRQLPEPKLNRLQYSKKEIMLKTCTGPCGKEKEISEYYSHKHKEKIKYDSKCKECCKLIKSNKKEYLQKYYEAHKEEIKIKHKIYDEIHSEKIKLRKQEYHKIKRKEHSEYQKVYFQSQENRNKKNLNRNKKRNEARKNNPMLKIRDNISRGIRKGLKSNNKNGQSINTYYTNEEIQTHFLNLMDKSWMTLENYGRYNPKIWDDNDPSTWTWQIDHIIPQSEFIYFSMDDEECKACWALSNLRPLSAKQNHQDGINRTRHKKKN